MEDKTQDGKRIKAPAFQNFKKLTEEQKKRGTLKGRIRHWSDALKCYFYIRPDKDFKETEQRYIEHKNAFFNIKEKEQNGQG